MQTGRTSSCACNITQPANYPTTQNTQLSNSPTIQLSNYPTIQPTTHNPQPTTHNPQHPNLNNCADQILQVCKKQKWATTKPNRMPGNLAKKLPD
jgi:hypothetical protein